MKLKLKLLMILSILPAVGCQDAYPVHVFFDNVEGLEENAVVLANGMKVGNVDAMVV